jgi:hypothetical protein
MEDEIPLTEENEGHVGFEVLTAVVMMRFYLMGYNVVKSVESQPTYRELCLPHTFKLVSCSASSSTVKMEVECSSETLVYFKRTTRFYISEDRTLQIISD